MKKIVNIKNVLFEVMEETFSTWVLITPTGDEILVEKDDFEKRNDNLYEYVGLGQPNILQRICS